MGRVWRSWCWRCCRPARARPGRRSSDDTRDGGGQPPPLSGRPPCRRSSSRHPRRRTGAGASADPAGNDDELSRRHHRPPKFPSSRRPFWLATDLAELRTSAGRSRRCRADQRCRATRAREHPGSCREDRQPSCRSPTMVACLADVIFEENVEHLTRFIAIFHSRLPDTIGPIRSARTSDLNILAAFNRPVLAWSGGNKNVTAAVRSAASSGILVNISAQSIGRCYRRVSAAEGAAQPGRRSGVRVGAAQRQGRPCSLVVRRCVRAAGRSRRSVRRADGRGRVSWVWDPASGKLPAPAERRPHVAAGWQRRSPRPTSWSCRCVHPEPGRCAQSGSADAAGR